MALNFCPISCSISQAATHTRTHLLDKTDISPEDLLGFHALNQHIIPKYFQFYITPHTRLRVHPKSCQTNLKTHKERHSMAPPSLEKHIQICWQFASSLRYAPNLKPLPLVPLKPPKTLDPWKPSLFLRGRRARVERQLRRSHSLSNPGILVSCVSAYASSI